MLKTIGNLEIAVSSRYFSITRRKKNQHDSTINKQCMDLDADEIFDLVHAVNEIQRALVKIGSNQNG